VERKNEMSAVREKKVLRSDFNTLLTESGHFFDKSDGVKDNAVTDNAKFSGPENARGNEVQDVLLAIGNDGVTSVVATLTASDDVSVFSQEVNELTFTFVAPLGADNDGIHDAGLLRCWLRKWNEKD
jgi:hypothetical protein